MANEAIRKAARCAGVPFWAIAQALEISEATMTRRMRTELSPEETERVLRAIENLRHGQRAEQLILK